MRNSALLVLLVSLPSPSTASADWLLVSQDTLSKIYLDPASRKTLPDSVIFARALTDYDPQAPEATAFKLSEKGLSEIENVLIDCGKEAYRSDGGRWFDGHMATGAVRSDYPAKPAWSKAPPFYSHLLAKLCGKE
jgi:hypothetical protein